MGKSENADNRSKAEKFWDRTAGGYTSSREIKRGKNTLRLIEQAKKHVKTTDNVLDFGCGTGFISERISESVQSIHAIDFSSRMIDYATRNSERTNIDYWHTTIFDERLKPGSYDVIFSFYILHLLDDPKKTIQRLEELLKPGGVFLSVTPCMGEKLFLKGLLSLFCKLGAIPKIEMYRSGELVKLIEEGGFIIQTNNRFPNTTNQYFVLATKSK